METRIPDGQEPQEGEDGEGELIVRIKFEDS